MPTREAIVDSIIPKDVPKPIPVRTISTRSPKPSTHQALAQNGNQPATSSDPAAVSATPEESVRLSPQVSALARKEQAFRQRELALKQREKDLEAKLADAEQLSQLKTKIGAKDFSEAEKLGLNYDEYVQYKLKQAEGEAPQAVKFKSLEDEIQALKKSQEENANEQFEETVAAYRKELTSIVDTAPEFSKVKKFKDTDEHGKEFTGVDVALQFILDSWEQDNEEISVSEAAKLTATFIEQKAKQWASLVDEQKPVETEAKPLPPPKPSVKTLTNQMQPNGETKVPQKSLQHLSESERYAEARRRVLARRQQQGI